MEIKIPYDIKRRFITVKLYKKIKIVNRMFMKTNKSEILL